MVVPTQEALSAVDRAVTKDDVLRLIIGHTIQPIFLRPHLNIGQKWALVLGAIGDRGGGKSALTATIAVVDHMLSGETVFSNLEVKCDIGVDDETALPWGLNSGGTVHYQTEQLDKEALLKLDERYYRNCLLIEEINVGYSNARRFMTNTNVDFNEVCQQLRKLEASLLFNVIDEMFIDVQLRALCDIFIKSYDTAFDLDGLERHKPRGLDFNWQIYPMSGYLRGEQGKYVKTKKAIGPVNFHFAGWQGIFDSMQHQEKGIYSISTKEKNKALQAQMTATSSQGMVDEVDAWSWLGEKALLLKNSGITEIEAWQLWQHLELNKRGISPRDIRLSDRLPGCGIRKYRQDKFGKWIYKVEEFTLSSIN